jgi:hypothetical protein
MTLELRLIALGVTLAALVLSGVGLHHRWYTEGYTARSVEVAKEVEEQKRQSELIKKEQDDKTVKLQKKYYTAKSDLTSVLERMRDTPYMSREECMQLAGGSTSGVSTETKSPYGANSATKLDGGKEFFAKAMSDNLQCVSLIEWIETQGMKQ